MFIAEIYYRVNSDSNTCIQYQRMIAAILDIHRRVNSEANNYIFYPFSFEKYY